MFVFCLFAPSPHGYPVSRGVPKIKIVRILMRLWFSRRVLKNPVYFGVHDFSGSAEKAEYRKIMTILQRGRQHLRYQPHF